MRRVNINTYLKFLVVHGLVFSLVLSSFAPYGQASNETPHSGDLISHGLQTTSGASESSPANGTSHDYSEVASFLTRRKSMPRVPPSRDALPHYTPVVWDSVKKPTKDLLTSLANSAVVYLVILGTQEVRRRVEKDHIAPTPGNILKVTEQWLSETYTTQGTTGILGQIFAFGVNNSISYGLVKALTVALKTKLSRELIISVVSSTVLTVTTNINSELIKLATYFTIQHEKDFKLTPQEKTALAQLQGSNGPGYFFQGLVNGGPVTRSAYGKTSQALLRLIVNDDEFRKSLWEHLISEVFTSGDMWAVIEISIVTAVSRTIIMNGRTAETMGTFRYNSTNILVSLLSSIFSTAITPEALRDTQSYLAKGFYAAIHVPFDFENESLFVKRFAPLAQSPSGNREIQPVLDRMASNREIRFNLHLRLLKMSFDRLVVRNLESQYFQGYSKQLESEAAKMAERYEGELGSDFKAKMSLTGRQIYDLVGNRLNDWNIRYYQELYQRSTNNMVGLYSHDIDVLGSFERRLPESPLRDKIRQEVAHLQELQASTKTLIDSLTPWIGRDAKINELQSQPGTSRAKSFLDTATFWMPHELDLLVWIKKGS